MSKIYKDIVLSLVSNEQSKTDKTGGGYGGGTKNRKICYFDLYLLNIDIIN